MKIIISKQHISIMISALSLAGLMIFGFTGTHKTQAKSVQLGQGTHVDFEYEDDFSNDQVLMGAFHNVFIGKVLNQVEAKKYSDLPETNYSVDVISDIKGHLAGTVVVKQIAGLAPGVRADGSPLLVPGSTYLLATRGDGKEGFYVLGTTPYAQRLITDNATLKDADLSSLAETDGRVRALEAAYPHEIPMHEDVMHDFTVNAFAKLPPEAHAAAVARAQAADKWLAAHRD